MLTVLLQEGGGNWLAFWVSLIVLVAALKGTQLLLRSLKRKRHRKHMLSGMHYDGIMDEFITRERK